MPDYDGSPCLYLTEKEIHLYVVPAIAEGKNCCKRGASLTSRAVNNIAAYGGVKQQYISVYMYGYVTFAVICMPCDINLLGTNLCH